jgi:dihydrofolate reductase
MARLIYLANMSLDGYIEDESGDFDWLAPDDDVFLFTTELLRSVGTFLYGRRMYETMAVWETDAVVTGPSDGDSGQRLSIRGEEDRPAALVADFATAWRAASKVVYSATLASVPTADTRLVRHFDPTSVQELTSTASSDLTVGGANLAAQALRAGLVDECRLFVWPLIVGGGKPALPTDMRVGFELLHERRFGNGVVYIRYRPVGP